MAQTLSECWTSKPAGVPALKEFPVWLDGRQGNCAAGPRTGKMGPLGTHRESGKASQRRHT